MDINILQDFFFLCMVVNIGIYMLTGLAWISLRGFYTRLLKKMFGLDEEAIQTGVFKFLGNYKLLITVFNFVPWIAILIIRQSQ